MLLPAHAKLAHGHCCTPTRRRHWFRRKSRAARKHHLPRFPGRNISDPATSALALAAQWSPEVHQRILSCPSWSDGWLHQQHLGPWPTLTVSVSPMLRSLLAAGTVQAPGTSWRSGEPKRKHFCTSRCACPSCSACLCFHLTRDTFPLPLAAATVAHPSGLPESNQQFPHRHACSSGLSPGQPPDSASSSSHLGFPTFSRRKGCGPPTMF